MTSVFDTFSKVPTPSVWGGKTEILRISAGEQGSPLHSYFSTASVKNVASEGLWGALGGVCRESVRRVQENPKSPGEPGGFPGRMGKNQLL